MHSKWALGVVVVAVASCSGSNATCSGAVDVQIFNNHSELLTGSAKLAGSDCMGEELVAAQDAVPTYLFSRDLSAGDQITYQVEGSMLTCTVHQKGVDITYVRAEILPGKSLQCSCGFQEYYATAPLDSCE